jgi:putative FmdB family regulatory protein
VPTYQYACSDCDHAFEQVQSFTEDSLTTCPQCEGRLRKVFNAVGVVFKGSGFYRTDNRSDTKSSSATTTSSSDSSSSTTPTSTTKSEAGAA